jgi:hypothetical protein
MEEVEIGTVVCCAFAFLFVTSYGFSEFRTVILVVRRLRLLDFAHRIYKG